VLFLDSSDPSEIREIFTWGVVSGITTNPLILSRDPGAQDLEVRIREVIQASRGSVSVELTHETEPEMLQEAAAYHAWDPERVCIKVPFSETGLKVLSQLRARGVHTNMTCMMNFNQAYLASLAGATYVSLFSGRIRDMGYDARPIIRETRAIIDREGLPSQILIGSIRHLMDVNEALQDGAHIVTVPPPILRKMLWNPQTERTIAEFNTAWHNRTRP
jgi:transaldolase